MSQTFVLSVGGSLVAPASGLDVAFLCALKRLLLSRTAKGDRFYLVIGGGMTARRYIQAAQVAGQVSTEARDWLGISATRLNAQLVKTIFGAAAYPEVIADPTRKIKTNKKIIIAAGYKPGWSTDCDAVLLARQNKIREIINLSNIDYAYDRDPKLFPEARRLESISWPEFRKIVGNKWRPGLNVPFDPIASRAAAAGRMKVMIINGQKMKNLAACLAGRKFIGTTIS